MSYKKLVLLAFVVFGGFLLPSCTKKDPSVLKIFVRSSDFILTEDASVRIVSDIKKGTPEYFDEVKTNSSGVAIFNLDELFDQYGKKDEKVAYFTVYAKDTTTYQTVGTARAKAYLTSTESIILKN
ncbi:hypothetical protein [Brumimicrobium sp.]|uniref:hypothetical protein n=1 Tax=Brumimicrobium sp. TaxID=2029867 RepID=UPI0026256ED5|nr:hypothetical protein [uncultured Brumimicrobium sp.]